MHSKAIDCIVIFLNNVMGVGPTNLGKEKASMKSCNSLKRNDGLSIVTWRNSSWLEISGYIMTVDLKGK
jgi:hypothetical protein